MNAAVTFANCALRRLPWKKFPVYVLGQFLGSFMAAGTIYGLFYSEWPTLAGASGFSPSLKHEQTRCWCSGLETLEETSSL